MSPAAAPPARPVLDRRRAGVLLHPGSLPSHRLDRSALEFIGCLAAGGFAAWQMLPLGPTGRHGSPYSPSSAFAGNVHLLPRAVVDTPVELEELQEFRCRTAAWLDDYALFSVLHLHHRGLPWWAWPPGLRWREPGSLARCMREHAAALDACVRQQYLFERNWQTVRAAARRHDILLLGDLPLFVVADSADVWAHPQFFKLDAGGRARYVAGVPPDAFAPAGQCWNNPVYDWDQAGPGLFDWWVRRLRHECERFDLVRWDHFRGLQATWEIPPGREGRPASAREGQWREVPGRGLLQTLTQALGQLPVVAENLGVITPQVEQLRHDFHLPVMHVLQFAFDGDPANPHLPDRHEEQGVVYTGTHDNDTTRGWLESLDAGARQRIVQVLGCPSAVTLEALLDSALGSRARLAMFPAQDLLALGSSARMNVPGRAQGQWRWSLPQGAITVEFSRRFLPRLRDSLRA